MNPGRCESLDDLPDLYTIFRGEVVTVTEYGAFIKIPGCRKQGLVHRTHMSSCRVDKPSEIVDVGDKVWVKLIGREMKNDKVKLSLSMKVVNQGTGKDLDPNNIVTDQEERRKRTFKDYTGQKITLEAVLNTTCKKCGCRGHFAKDCFMQPGGTKYSLIPEEEEEEEEEAAAKAEVKGEEKSVHTEKSSRKRKKEKKKKKKLKSKKEPSSSSSDSDSSEGQTASKKARHLARESKRKMKKHRKKHQA
ncbi:zinc finger CCHC domain-containing protein 17 isoform X1 [Monodelphis domestica]|uniref:Zinc finger CCHC domain-containing protein 17 n=2 Tax=Monodelphis domestica TaxID=13616 RepID=A0A5F8HHQ1_MONDO|nr:zinc finger CCHC domain-containing protein 17 isoform X1 [Monodelphis domestica]XP_007493040.1 zinc finger CCHC domain-containing protein 17 isoform X1 [Monodelphis domestica]XP_056651333.1 zinc finger CCHC domain-containing protein 17 isoform X1 [Monodelphis domestica]XP_056651334.1 zinc finger CCHC domain-containing protein 17 isoform X1 [Monodelphis domestica]XP_056651335.1 zinc finger CCHC domain-containing protein 17 isoform X1 [Monodelphis domestica]